jgi:hypothetical protein
MAPLIPRVTKGIFVEPTYSSTDVFTLIEDVQSRQNQNSGLTIFLADNDSNGTLKIFYHFPDGTSFEFQSHPVIKDQFLTVDIPYGVPQISLTYQPAAQPGRVRVEVVNY